MKQFAMLHGQGSLNVGTDSIILGAWSEALPGNIRILDIGTGCGILSLMLAQRFPAAMIKAIEPSNRAATFAGENFRNSPWPERFDLRVEKIQTPGLFESESFDVIVTNPPYYDPGKNFTRSSRGIDPARAGTTLNTGELAAAIKSYLKKDGKASMILPQKEAAAMIEVMTINGLYVNRQLNIKPDPSKEHKRCCLQFSHDPVSIRVGSLPIYADEKHQAYSINYMELTSEYLIHDGNSKSIKKGR